MIYKLKLKDYFRLGEASLFYVLPFLAFICIGPFIQIENYCRYVIAAAGLLLILIGTMICLHIRYYEFDKNLTIEELDECIVVFEDNEILLKTNHQNIISFDIFMSPNMVQFNTGRGLPIELYCYTEIATTQGSSKITNLLYPDIKRLGTIFSQIKPTFCQRLFAFP